MMKLFIYLFIFTDTYVSIYFLVTTNGSLMYDIADLLWLKYFKPWPAHYFMKSKKKSLHDNNKITEVIL